SIGLPDVHSGYGFAVGNVAAFDMADPDAVVSPGEACARIHVCLCVSLVWVFSIVCCNTGAVDTCFSIRMCTPTIQAGGVGFDINCGVRLVRANLTLEDVLPVKEELTQSLFDHIPVGVGTKGVVPITAADLND
ncbi:unnamed protein product, partial [Ectocarpus sp. 8 AP-2014]